jgi:hypothetical protein
MPAHPAQGGRARHPRAEELIGSVGPHCSPICPTDRHGETVPPAATGRTASYWILLHGDDCSWRCDHLLDLACVVGATCKGAAGAASLKSRLCFGSLAQFVCWRCTVWLKASSATASISGERILAAMSSIPGRSLEASRSSVAAFALYCVRRSTRRGWPGPGCRQAAGSPGPASAASP